MEQPSVDLILRFFTNTKHVGKENGFLFSSSLGTEQRLFRKIARALLCKIKWPIIDLPTQFFRSVSSFESCLKGFRREEGLTLLTFVRVKQSPHSGGSYAGTRLAHKVSATLHVLGVALILHNLSNRTLNQRTTLGTGDGNTTPVIMVQSSEKAS